MLTVVLIVLAVASAWALLAVLFAFLAGGVIHARDHRDAPYGGFSGPRPITPLPVLRTPR
ncbi:hypothetical protein [Amnibacterium kyonggiense]|uniref:Uncharacterized protein n=1 Tax=Amnibacterium kyonggiense TaxID=595671 RepID=A0A4R7FFF3_9MICO|nr:hypothetical protein [Amnibacterium kyonggiense]TDS74863.1 hypothetical protein CLV52_3385 [Amnibacterium kyonggiense]